MCDMKTNILSYLESTAARLPQKLALSDGKSEVTFGEWLDCAKRIGSLLIENFPGEMRRPVMVFVDRRVETLVGFMGVVDSGNFYVPIAEDIASRVFTLPTYYGLLLDDVRAIAKTSSKSWDYDIIHT